MTPEDGRVVGRLGGHEGATHGVAVSPDGRLLASGGSDSTLRIWDLEDDEELFALREHEAYIWRLAWSRDGEALFTGSGDGAVRRGSAAAAATGPGAPARPASGRR